MAWMKVCACEGHGFESKLQAREHHVRQSVKRGPEVQQYFKIHYIPGKSHALKPDLNHCKLQLLFPQDFLNVFGSTHRALFSILLPWCFSILTIHFREQACSQLK